MSQQPAIGTYDQRRAAVFRRNAALCPAEKASPEWWAWLRESARRIEDFDRNYLLRRTA